MRDIYVVSKVSVEKRFYALLNSVSLMFWHNETKLGDFADLVGAESFLDHKENLKEEEMTCRRWTIMDPTDRPWFVDFTSEISESYLIKFRVDNSLADVTQDTC